MSQVARTRFQGDVLRRRRNLEDRLNLQFQGAYRALAAAVMRLSPRSRLRRTLLKRQVVSGWAAFSRDDLDLVLVRYAPDYQFEAAPQLVGVGIPSGWRGHSGLRGAVEEMKLSWARIDQAPSELVDAGNPLVVLSGPSGSVGVAPGSSLRRRWR